MSNVLKYPVDRVRKRITIARTKRIIAMVQGGADADTVHRACLELAAYVERSTTEWFKRSLAARRSRRSA